VNQMMQGEGQFGQFWFTEPVSNLSVSWTTAWGIYMNFTNGGDEVESVLMPPIQEDGHTFLLQSGEISLPGSGYFGGTWTTDQSFPDGSCCSGGPGGISS